MIDKREIYSPATGTVTNGRVIAGWQIKLLHRLSQAANQPGIYYFRLEVKQDGKRVLQLMEKDENLGK